MNICANDTTQERRLGFAFGVGQRWKNRINLFAKSTLKQRKKRLAEFRAEKKQEWRKCEMTCPEFCPFDDCKLPSHVAAKTIGIIDHGERIREPGRAVIFGTIPRNVHF